MSVSELETCLDRRHAVAADRSYPHHFRQPIRASLAAGARAVSGLALVGAVAAGISPGGAGFAILGGIGGLFAWYGARSCCRHMTVISLSDAEIASSGWPWQIGAVAIRWAELDGVTLRYFSTRRDREKGWAELVLRSGRQRLALESEHPAFEMAARRAVAAAARNDVSLNPATAANVEAMGLRTAANGKTS